MIKDEGMKDRDNIVKRQKGEERADMQGSEERGDVVRREDDNGDHRIDVLRIVVFLFLLIFVLFFFIPLLPFLNFHRSFFSNSILGRTIH